VVQFILMWRLAKVQRQIGCDADVLIKMPQRLFCGLFLQFKHPQFSLAIMAAATMEAIASCFLLLSVFDAMIAWY